MKFLACIGGQPTDAPFYIAMRIGGRAERREAILAAINASQPSYTVSNTNCWNGNRPNPIITRTGVGRYHVEIPGLGASGGEYGHAQVHQLGYPGVFSAHFATVNGPIHLGGSAICEVRCFDVNGLPEDNGFFLSYQQFAAPISGHIGSGGHLYANQPMTATYTPLASRRDHNCTFGSGAPETIQRLGTGAYRVTLPHLDPASSKSFQLTPVVPGLTAAHATVRKWEAAPGGGTDVYVDTMDAAGNPTDHTFHLDYLCNRPAADAATSNPVGSGCHGLVLNANRPLLGESWDLRLNDVPATSLIGLIVIGFANPSVDLSTVGAPGCFLYADTVLIEPVLLPAAQPAYGIAIPMTSTLIGFEMFTQGAVYDPTVNALNIATSNGQHGTVGDI